MNIPTTVLMATQVGVTSARLHFDLNPLPADMPAAVAERLHVQASVAYLVGRGLLVAAPRRVWDETRTLTIPPELRPDPEEVRRQHLVATGGMISGGMWNGGVGW